ILFSVFKYIKFKFLSSISVVKPGFFDQNLISIFFNDISKKEKSIENQSIIEGLTNHTDTLTSHKAFNAYVRQNYLDNILRGGYPIPIHTKKGKEIFYVYSRKHGDLERDYNNYVVPPTYFSQGNGNYRDINQNRRNDIFFNPEVEDSNLILFMSMLQADGFNPHVLKRLTFQLRDRALARKLRTCVKDSLDLKKLSDYLTNPFDPGTLFLWLEKENIPLVVSKDKFLNSVLSICEKDEDIFHGEGFWSDHWHYNNDLIESFLSVYPDRLRELLLDRAVYTFYDNDHRVVPRSEKYVFWEGQVRQFGSVVHDPEKTELIESRSYDKNKLRLGNGHGEIYRTNLFTKILFIFANKIASLDAEGIGIEMESDKPNWNDSLNGLPGLFGSSTAETCELVRMIRTLKENLEDLSLPDEYILNIPRELSEFLNKIETALDHWKGNHASSKHYDYWEASTSAKEKFREDIRMGLNGDFVPWSLEMIKPLLDKAVEKLQNGLERAKAPKSQVMSTYFRSTAKDFQPSEKTNLKGYPCMNISGFKHQALPLFLEGPVHLFRILKNDTKSKRLYQAIKRSPLFDKKLKMYKVSSSMAKEPPEIGRIQIFSPGWLENESIWMHMEYKYLLEILKSGLTREFYNDIKTCLVPFMDPKIYGRSILENSSFICSSAYPDDLLHGNGFVARLSGSTAEWIHIWLLMMLGAQPFRLDQDKKLQFIPEPSLDAWLFTNKKHVFQGVLVPKNSLAFVTLKDTLFIYSNPKRKPTFGAKRVKVQRFTLTWRDGRTEEIACGFLRGKSVYDIRQGRVKLVEMQLG
ncbi:cellobiose phosphorylase, partial [PVC group bacterium]|nr:cellobiose phosphorylase [PVC group bacterium]